MLLPSDNVLDVLHCVDFATLLALQRAGSAFYDVVRRNQPILPRLRVFRVYLDLAMATAVQKLQETTDDMFDTVQSYPSDDGDDDVVPFTDELDYSTLRSFADTVGTNFVESALIVSTLGPMRSMEFDMRKAVEDLPALQHVRDLSFDCQCLMHDDTIVDMELLEALILSPLDTLQSLDLSSVNSRTDWAFLRKHWALRLRSLSVEAYGLFYETGESGIPDIDASGQAEILEFCTDFVHLPKGKSKIFQITGWKISPEFLERIVTPVSDCNDWLTVLVEGSLGFAGNDEDYARVDVRSENDDYDFVRNSSRDGSHRVFVRTLYGTTTVAVTNNPFVTTWSDTYDYDVESF